MCFWEPTRGKCVVLSMLEKIHTIILLKCSCTSMLWRRGLKFGLCIKDISMRNPGQVISLRKKNLISQILSPDLLKGWQLNSLKNLSVLDLLHPLTASMCQQNFAYTDWAYSILGTGAEKDFLCNCFIQLELFCGPEGRKAVSLLVPREQRGGTNLMNPEGKRTIWWGRLAQGTQGPG